jgi:ribonuclease BN (tRNA processing enzyme)
VKLTVLGCSGVYAAPGNPCSGYLVQSGGLNVLVDAGAGVLGALQRHLPLDELDAVVVSHSHPDHWVEVPILRNALRHVLGVEGLELYAPADVLRLADQVSHEHLAPTLRPHRLTDASEVDLGGVVLRCSRTRHPPETLAFSLDDGAHRLGYSADTGPGWDFRSLGAPVDLAVCEATFREADGPQDPVHMTAREAGEAAAVAGARQLLLTHLLPGADPREASREAESAYGAAVDVAHAGLVVEL